MDRHGSNVNRRTATDKRETPRKDRPEPSDVDADWRLFIAVPMSDEVRARIREVIDRLLPANWPMRWIDADSAHLTLHFLGDTPPEQAAIIRLALPSIVASHESFDLRTAGLGVFPKLRRPRVVWLGVYGPTHRLESLFNELGDELDEMLLPIEERPFSPHITLGRVRDIHNAPMRQLPEKIRKATEDLAREGLADPKNGLTIPIEEVHLIRSHLDRDGAHYELIERFPLAPTPRQLEGG